MDEYTLLLPSATALLLLLACLGCFHWFFQVWQPRWPRGARLQHRLGYPAVGLALSLPVWWLSLHLEELTWTIPGTVAVLEYFAAWTLLEVVLCLLMDSSSGPRVPESLQRAVRLTAYGLTALIPLADVLGLPVFERRFQERVGSVLLLYLALHLVYTYVFKGIHWRHPLALALRKRLRIWAYLLVMGLVTYLAVFRLGLLETRSATLLYFQTGLGVLAGILVFEAVLACLFDFYYPTVRGSDVPTLFYDLARGVGYLAIVALCTVLILHRDISSLLLGSAVISVAVGFALQETLGHLIAGLALRLARPFVLGDRIEVLSQSGTVQKIDWRSTSILNSQGDIVIIPNSKLAAEVFINHSSPTPVTGRFIELGAAYRHPPNLVKAVMLEACQAVPEVLAIPAPEVYAMSFEDSAINYRLRLFIDNFSERFRIDSMVRESIWYHFTRAGIEIPYPTRQLISPAPAEDAGGETEIRKLLESVDFFSVLEPADVASLAHRARFVIYAAGEKVFVQGQEGDSFYIIHSGTLEVQATDADGHVFLSAQMGSGKYFGEMALLTGEPRSATITALSDAQLFRLAKEDLRGVLRDNPQVEGMISEVLARRKLRTAQALQEAEEGKSLRASEVADQGDRIEQLAQQFLSKIRGFFSY